MKRKVFIALLIFWPWVLIGLQIIALILATNHGCRVSALGYAPCIVFGRDVGEFTSSLWTVGFQFGFSLLWVGPAAIIWAIVKPSTRKEETDDH